MNAAIHRVDFALTTELLAESGPAGTRPDAEIEAEVEAFLVTENAEQGRSLTEQCADDTATARPRPETIRSGPPGPERRDERLEP